MPGKRQRTQAFGSKPRKARSPSESSGSDSGDEVEHDSDAAGGNDQYLHSDSEEDEFEGLATYEVDDWDGDDAEDGSGTDEEDDGEAVCYPLLPLVHWQNAEGRRK